MVMKNFFNFITFLCINTINQLFSELKVRYGNKKGCDRKYNFRQLKNKLNNNICF